MPIYHFLYYGYEKTVIDSQVVTPATLLASDGVRVHLVLMERWDVFLTNRPKLPSLPDGVSVTFLPRMPRNILFLNSLLVFFFLLLFLLPLFFGFKS
jgi:hypothetical protein